MKQGKPKTMAGKAPAKKMPPWMMKGKGDAPKPGMKPAFSKGGKVGKGKC